MSIKKTVLNFNLKKTKEKMIARSGVAMFSEFLHSMHLPNIVNKIMPKTLSNSGFDAWDYIHTLLLTLYGGGEGISDTREIKRDKALREICNIPIVPSESAIGDWMRRMGDQSQEICIKKVNQKILMEIFRKKNIKEVTLINDPSVIISNKRDAKMTYKGHKGYRPAMIFIKELNMIALCEFRHGNDNGRRFEFFNEIFKIIPSDIKIKLVLMDSEFYDGKIFSLLMKKNIDFIIAVSKNSSVNKEINKISDAKWEKCKDEDGVSSNREVAETVHVMNSCPTPFRLVVLRWKNSKVSSGYCYHALATTIKKDSIQQIVSKYNSRACGENDIKELKNGFGMRKMPCGDFYANAIFFGIGVLCYNLFSAQKFLSMPKNFWKKTIKTIRWILVEIPGKVISTATETTLKIAVHNDKFEIFKYMRRKNYDLSIT